MNKKMENDQYSNNSDCQEEDLHGAFGILQPSTSIALLIVSSRTENLFGK